MSDNQKPNAQTNADSDKLTVPQRPIIKVNPANVPPELHPLIPYAEKWGISDSKLQSKMLHEAPIEEILEIYEITYPLWDDIWDFVLSHPNPDDPVSHEVNIFNNFRNSL